uniref:DUF4283 domain-containing protein n=1 Tax=Tanacetum cinerariifolium TaxID=118510 RepID=A0A6L2LW68_TANCI|nr:hypothetical protein [Tanacetum cinerariifolium]
MLEPSRLEKKKKMDFDQTLYFFRSNKRYKGSVKFDKHPIRTVLNEPILRMIYFNDQHRQYFISIEVLLDLNDEAQYNIHNTFFRLCKGPVIDDHARTFSSILIAEVDKKNERSLEKMRVIEEIRQFEMDKRTDLNKLNGIAENLLERIRRSRELRATTLSDEGINPGMFDYNGNLKPSKSILKKGISPTKEGRKVSMNASTMVAKEIGKVSKDGESEVSTNPNPSPNINVNATEFEKDVATTVNTASDKVLNSFASILKHKVNRVAEIIELRNDECVEGAAVMIPLAAIEEVTSRFENTLYGYFVGKRLAYQVVENYVKNVWSKYGLKRIQLYGEFFLFQFETKEGVNRVDYGAWLIRRVPLLLNIWSPNSNLHKAEIKKVPLDAYTSDMCLNSWGRSAYARALIEISAEDVLKEDLVIVIPVGKDKGHSLASIRIEYEWRPPRVDKGDSSKNVAPMSTGNVASTSSVPTTTSTNRSGASAAKSKVSLNNSFSALNNDEDSEW